MSDLFQDEMPDDFIGLVGRPLTETPVDEDES